jgi:multidrug efflux system membrane fusion protein
MSEQNQIIVEEKPKVLRHRKRRRWLAALLFVIICAILSIPLLMRPRTGTGGPQAMGGPGGPPGGGPGFGGPNAPTPVTTATVTTEPMSVFIDAIGTVTPEKTASIYSQVSGQLLAVNYTEGQIVRQGQSLIEVDPRPYQALLDQARGALARDRSLLHQAQVNEQRYEDALKRNAISQQTLFDQQAAVQQYQGTIQNDEGSVKYYEVQLGYCHIVAPFTGRIGLRLVDPGNTIFSGASNTLAVITQLDPITVVFSIPEDDVQRVQDRLRRTHTMKVDLFDRTQNQRIAAGSLLAFDNQIDTTTGTIKFRARFRNPSGALFPNQFVNARLLVDTLPAAQVLPTSVVQYNGQQAFVYAVDQASNTVHLQNITVTNEANDKSAVQGLAPGAMVAASNFDRLQDGAKVMIAGHGMPPFGPRASGPGGTPEAGGKSAGPGEPPPTSRKPGPLTGASR